VHDLWWQLLWEQGDPSTLRIAQKLGVSIPVVSSVLRDLRHQGVIPQRQTGSTLVPEEWLARRFYEQYPLAVELAENGLWAIAPEDEEDEEDEEEAVGVFPNHITPADVGYPVDEDAEDKDAIIADLRQEINQLKAMLEYSTHANFEGLTGGTMAFHTSDHHFHNAGHLLHAFESVTSKACEAIRRFQPRRFINSIGGDTVQGRGIFRNQHLDNVLNKREQQIGAAAWRLYEYDQALRAALPEGVAPEHIVVQGNHDYSDGDSTCMEFVWAVRQLGVEARFVGQRWVQNIADEGCYNVLVNHGYGNSMYSPSPNKLIVETQKTLIDLSHRGYVGEKEIRRVWHGHTHWRSGGTEHAPLVPFDVTGGMHRNDRANIGMNQRPAGWWLFISPPGSDDILQPLPIIPSNRAMRADMDDPELEERNRADASRCIIAWAEKLREMGVVGDWRTEMPDQEAA